MNVKNIKKDYMSGLKYKDIQEKNNITNSQLIYLIQKNKWKRKSNRSEALKKNQNAKGNKGGPGATKGNKRALTTGEYENIFSGVFSEAEKTIFNDYKLKDKQTELLHELKILTIRESRMLDRIKVLENSGKDMVINNISKTNYQNTSSDIASSITTHTYAENTIIAIQKIEDGLTRVQEARRRCIDSLNKIGIDDRKLELDLIRLEREASKYDTPEDDVKDDSFIKALEDSVENVWDDYDGETE